MALSGDGELPGGAHGFLGPVEAAEGTGAPAPPRRRKELTRRQKYALAALLLTGGATVVVRGALRDHGAAAAAPAPFPGQIAHFGYGGQASAASGPGGEFQLRVLARNDGPGPVAITDVRQEYAGLSLSVSGPMPRSVPSGGTAELLLAYRVTDCGRAPADAGLPFIDVTLRNTRAIQTVSQILGSDYARDLSRNLHAACPNSGMRSGVSATPSLDTAVR